VKKAIAAARAGLERAENALASAALLLMALIPALELFLRSFLDRGLPGAAAYVQNLTLWAGFLGAMVAARAGRHLSLTVMSDRLPGRAKLVVGAATGALSAGVAAALSWASWEFMRSEMAAPEKVAGWIPQWIAVSILPFAFASTALRFALRPEGWAGKAAGLAGIGAAWVIGFPLEAHAAKLLWPGIGLLGLAALLGAPLFTAMGGSALLLFFADGVPAASVPVETYRLVVSPSLPTIPLFTLAGFLLAEGKASGRLLKVFQSCFGWMPGGMAVVTTLVCAFFTTFTGASGVTILALGGLLLPMLLQAGYRERFSLGLLTSSGSIGLLLPPSLPVILYAVVARVPIPSLFRAAVLPGLLLVGAVAVLGVREARQAKVPRTPFVPREAGRAAWEAKWELLLPVVTLWGLFGGYCTLIEAAALTVAYALLVTVGIHRELHPWRDLPRVLLESSMLIGGVIAILGVAMGMTSYLVDAEVPMKAASWVRESVQQRWIFLLALNAFLLLVGALMDIYSAILVVVPLVLPAAEAFGIDPLHLGVIFLVNMELGFLTPPVGANLFLASYRFQKPVLEVALRVAPFLLALLGVLLAVTYVPWLSLRGAPGSPAP
jgi:C4-dicarboxylate transporter DctM subunit